MSRRRPDGASLVFARDAVGDAVLQSPFSRRSDFTRLGILDKRGMTNRCVVANGLHWIWTPQGPAVWGRFASEACCAQGVP